MHTFFVIVVCRLLSICVYIFTSKVRNGLMGGDYEAFTTLPEVQEISI